MGHLRYLTAGESHGPALVAILEGLPAGLPLTAGLIADELKRRRGGHGRGPRMRVEEDLLEVVGGVRAGRSLGTPLALLIRNSEWDQKWSRVMAIEDQPVGRKLTRPRPGHADLPGMLKYDFDDARDVLERASARETAARVAIGAVVKTLLSELRIAVVSHVVAIGDVSVEDAHIEPTPADLELIDASPVRCLDAAGSDRMVAAIDAAASEGDSLGGVVEVWIHGLPPGIGSHVHWDRKLDGRLAGALMAVPSVKGVEIGRGFRIAQERGSRAHDEIEVGLGRRTARAGGTEGGMSTGQPIQMRVAMKPLSTLKKRLGTVDMATGEAAEAFQERTDTCAVPAGGVVCESVTALVIGDALLEMFPADTLNDLQAAFERYRSRIEARRRR